MSENKTTVDPAATAAAPAPEKNNPDIQNPDDKDMNEGLKKLSIDELVDIVRETRGEAKTRRLRQRELEEQIKKINDEKKLSEQAQLEQNQEFEKLYGKLKDETKDYEDLKQFKLNYLETCQEKVNNLKKGLTTAEVELFELSGSGQPFDNQLKIIEKIIQNKTGASPVDKTQSTFRTSGVNYTKEDLLKDTKLMAEVKENPSLYDKFFGKFK